MEAIMTMNVKPVTCIEDIQELEKTPWGKKSLKTVWMKHWQTPFERNPTILR